MAVCGGSSWRTAILWLERPSNKTTDGRRLTRRSCQSQRLHVGRAKRARQTQGGTEKKRWRERIRRSHGPAAWLRIKRLTEATDSSVAASGFYQSMQSFFFYRITRSGENHRHQRLVGLRCHTHWQSTEPAVSTCLCWCRMWYVVLVASDRWPTLYNKRLVLASYKIDAWSTNHWVPYFAMLWRCMTGQYPMKRTVAMTTFESVEKLFRTIKRGRKGQVLLILLQVYRKTWPKIGFGKFRLYFGDRYATW